MKTRFNKFDFSQINFIVLILGFLFITLGAFIQKKFFYYGILINEIFIIFLPGIFILRRNDMKKSLMLYKISFKNTLRIILIVIMAYPVVVFINGLFLSLLSNFIELKNYTLDIFSQEQSFWVYIFYLAVVPAICEETFFRGVLINSYNCIGKKFAIILSAFLFAIFHFDIQNFIAPFLLGVLFANLKDVTNTLYAAILGHFVNNLLGIIFSSEINYNIISKVEELSMVKEFGSLVLFLVISLLIISLISIFFIKRIINNIKIDRKMENIGIEKTHSIEAVIDFNIKGFLPLILLVIIYIGYYFVVVK